MVLPACCEEPLLVDVPLYFGVCPLMDTGGTVLWPKLTEAVLTLDFSFLLLLLACGFCVVECTDSDGGTRQLKTVQ